MTKSFDPTKPVQTRSGLAVRILATDLKSNDFPIVAAITDTEDGVEFVDTYTVDGHILKAEDNSQSDLVNIPEKAVHYLNFYRGMYQPGYIYKDRVEADRNAAPGRVACVRVEFENGQFDE